MAESHDATEQTLASWNRRERIVEAFEEAWESGKQPRLVDFLEGLDENQRRSVLLELIRVDLEFRLKADQPARVEDYLKDYPELHDERSVLVDLIRREFTLRCRVDSLVTPEEYNDRFPTLRDELEPCLKGAEHPSGTSEIGGQDHSERTAAFPSRVHGDPNVTLGEDHATNAVKPTGKSEFPTVEGYEILKPLGEGGMGVVYLARHKKLDRLVALKMIRNDRKIGKRDMARFRAEAEAVARLHHSSIVQIFEIGEVEGRPFFSLEYVEHGSLDGKIKQAPLPAREAARLGEYLARAMHHAHQHEIVHRDLKPSNVLLAASDAAEGVALAPGADGATHFMPKIADFGLAKRLDEDSSLTQHGVVLGTPSYMAPEQIPDPADGKLKPIGPAADVYALGALLYDSLVGRPPFKGATAIDTLGQVLQKEPIPLRQLQPEVDRDLETICLKCLEKSPAKRYASAAALADDLRRFQNREPILARPASRWERLRKWAARKPALASLIGVAAVALLATITAIGLSVKNLVDDAARKEAIITHQMEVAEFVNHDLTRAQQHENADQWQEAMAELNKAHGRLEAEPELRLDALRTQVEQRRAALQERIDGRAQALQREAVMQSPYDEVLFAHTAFTGADAAQNREKIFESAPKALALYGLAARGKGGDGELGILERDKLYLKAAEHARLAGACYELLLIWAKTEASAPPGQEDTDKERRARGLAAIELLDRVDRLGKAYGIETRTYQLYRAEIQAQSQGLEFDKAAAEKAALAAPASKLDWFQAALEYYRQDRYADAIAACDQVLQQNEKHYWAHYVTALCQLRLNQWSDARDQLKKCYAINETRVWPLVLRGFAAMESAVRQTNQKLADGEFAAAERDFTQALSRDKTPLLQYVALANRGVMNYRRRHLDEAIRDLKDAIKVNPAGLEAYINLSQAYQDLQQWNDAIQALDKAVEQAPRVPALLHKRAELHFARRNWAEAKKDYSDAIENEPKDSKSNLRVVCLVKLGWLLDRESNSQGALSYFDRAIAINPSYGLAHRFRAEALLRQKRINEAGDALDKYLASERDPPADIYFARGLVHAEKGEMTLAIEMYTLALARSPNDREIRLQRGWTYLRRNFSVDGALSDFEQCVRQNKGSAEALIGRGCARILKNQVKEALADAQESQSYGPLTDRLWYHLARLYAQASILQEVETRKGTLAQQAAATQQVVRLQKKAIDCLRRTLELMPLDRREAFWREQVQIDPALNGLRSVPGYGSLAPIFTSKGS
jgi:serine/threonine protein kinase/tetratricopeptide (TPR) repeat protein